VHEKIFGASILWTVIRILLHVMSNTESESEFGCLSKKEVKRQFIEMNDMDSNKILTAHKVKFNVGVCICTSTEGLNSFCLPPLPLRSRNARQKDCSNIVSMDSNKHFDQQARR
jgi:hypothetical protein